MMSRALFVLMALAASMPAVAQTRVVTLKAADEVVAAILSPRGDRIAAAVGKDRIAVWSLPDGKLLQELRFPQRTISALFAPSDQIIVALADGGIEVRAIATGAAVRRIEAGVRQSVLAVSADGRLLASSDTEQIRLWDLSGKLLRTFSHEFGSMSTLAFSPDGTLLASAGLDANVHFWDVSTGQQKASVPDQLVSTFAMTFTADGKNLVIGGASGAIEIVDVRTAAIARRFRVEKHAVSSISLSPDGRSIGAAYFDVDGMARAAPLAVWELASGRVVRRVTPPDAPAMVAGFSTDGRLLYATAKGPELNVWVLPGSGAPSAGVRSTAGSSGDR
jgi:tricorn protease-like protein